MTASEAAFVRALRDDPDDDTSLLVFADWLDDRSDPRAELLRIQCELSRWVPDLQRRQTLRQREEELLQQLEHDWLGPLYPYCLGWKRERGLCYLEMQTRRFHGKRFGKQAPEWSLNAWVGGVCLRGTTDLPFLLLNGEHLAAISGLDLSGNTVSGLTFQALVESPHLGNLRRLQMADCWVGDDELKRLADSPLLGQLRRLDLRNNRFTGQGLSALLNSADPARLHWLDVHGNDLDASAVESLLRWRSAHPRHVLGLRRLTNSLGMEFALVPGGTFLMGPSPEERDRYDDEDPLHAVTLTRSFYLGVYQVTQRQYEQVMGRNPSRFPQGRGDGSFHPVEQVTWNDAVEFCERLAQRPAEINLGYRYRLPTEAEWEHACRAGTETPFAFGRTISAHQANFDGNFPYSGGPTGPYRNATAPVGSYRPNAFGLFDMHGNVWEWCSDWFHDGEYGSDKRVDPVGPQYGYDRVLRGGGWYNNAGSCRSAYRYWDQPEDSDDDIGFRVVLISLSGS